MKLPPALPAHLFIPCSKTQVHGACVLSPPAVTPRSHCQLLKMHLQTSVGPASLTKLEGTCLYQDLQLQVVRGSQETKYYFFNQVLLLKR